jgi:hypothetical protein
MVMENLDTKHDLYAIGVQETKMSEKDLCAVLKKNVGPGYVQVRLARYGL